MYRINKLNALFQQNRHLFHIQDLGLIWNISNKNTLYTTINRYKKQGLLFPIYKGYYATKPVDKLHPWEIGSKAAHQFAYISCETILSQKGIINFIPSHITINCSQSKSMEMGGHHYKFRQLKDAYLCHSVGITQNDNFAYALPERAIADMLYFNPTMHFDAPIDWHTIRQLQNEIGYPETTR